MACTSVALMQHSVSSLLLCINELENKMFSWHDSELKMFCFGGGVLPHRVGACVKFRSSDLSVVVNRITPLFLHLCCPAAFSGV